MSEQTSTPNVNEAVVNKETLADFKHAVLVVSIAVNLAVLFTWVAANLR